MKTVLLTGATGFIGRHCIPSLLASSYEVHAVSSKAPRENFSDIYWHRADLLDAGQVAKLMDEVRPTQLLHFAWFAVPGRYWTSLENFRWVQASLDLLQAFARHGGRRVVVAGTCAEYDWKYGYCSEKVTPLAPRTLYGTCKHSLQLMLSAFAEQVGLSAAWGRIFFLYGPYEYQDRLVASVVRSLLRGDFARCSHGEQIRDFLHVRDVAEAFVTLLDSDVIGPVNIASGRPVALKDVVHKIAQELYREDLIQLGAVPVSANEPRLLIADVDRLTNEVGWSPKYELDEGLRDTIEWQRQNLAEASDAGQRLEGRQ